MDIVVTILFWAAAIACWFLAFRHSKQTQGISTVSGLCASCSEALAEKDVKGGPCGDDKTYCAKCKKDRKCGCGAT